MNDDATLLRLYSEAHDQAAFAELVGRHLGLVYNAALRRLNGDAHAAADVSQQAFLKLAANALKLSKHGALEAWLYATTRNAALDRLRSEHLRRQREQESVIMQNEEAGRSTKTDWEALRPELDAALDKLNETDRKALLLRFFSNQSFAEVGRALGLGEDAARRRTDRALDKLRLRLQRHGIHSSAAALATTLGAQAAAPVPATLLSQICAATPLSLAAGTGAGLAIAAPLVMSTTKILITSATISGACLVSLVWQYNRAEQAETRVARLEKRLAAQEEQLANARKSLAAKKPDMAADQAELASYLSNNRALEDELAKVTALREVLRKMPHLAVPEFALCTEADWLAVVEGRFETADDYRMALARLRMTAANRFGTLLRQALLAYKDSHNGSFPAQVSDLLPLADKRLTLEMMARYKIVHRSEIPNVRMGESPVITQAREVDPDYDGTIIIGANSMNSNSTPTALRAQMGQIQAVLEAYGKANGGKSPKDPEEVLRYATTDTLRRAVRQYLKLYPLRGR